MQQTRQHILEILKEKEQATVDEIVRALADRIGEITAVTVRHHLEVLRGDGLVAAPEVRRRTTPGRPQHIYTLTETALEMFPNNYRGLAGELLQQLKSQLPSREVNVILEGVADQIASGVQIGPAPLDARLDQVVNYLSEQGYNAYWEKQDNGFVLHTHNCPYHQLANDHQELCEMDFRMIAGLLGGTVPRRLGRMTDGNPSCSYFIPAQNIPSEQ